jgi:hypothetical protein
MAPLNAYKSWAWQLIRHDTDVHAVIVVNQNVVHSPRLLCQKIRHVGQKLFYKCRSASVPLVYQILLNTLRTEPDPHFGYDHFGQGFALTLSPNTIAGGRDGICSDLDHEHRPNLSDPIVICRKCRSTFRR